MGVCPNLDRFVRHAASINSIRSCLKRLVFTMGLRRLALKLRIGHAVSLVIAGFLAACTPTLDRATTDFASPTAVWRSQQSNPHDVRMLVATTR